MRIGSIRSSGAVQTAARALRPVFQKKENALGMRVTQTAATAENGQEHARQQNASDLLREAEVAKPPDESDINPRSRCLTRL